MRTDQELDQLVRSHPAYEIAVYHVGKVMPASIGSAQFSVEALRVQMQLAFLMGITWAADQQRLLDEVNGRERLDG